MTFTLSKRDLLELINTVLLIAVLVFVVWMRPWSTSSSDLTRTIKTSGQGTVEAVADEFTFRPSYEFKAATSDEVVTLGANKTTEVTNGLKDLGVEEKDIKIDASAYESWYREKENGEDVFRSYFTITVVTRDKDSAQKIQDYLLGTSATGSITPTPSFSTEKQKELADEARTKAIADARDAADKNASGLGVKIIGVVSVDETGGDDFVVYPMIGVAESSASDTASLPVATGQQEYTVNVSVTFEVK